MRSNKRVIICTEDMFSSSSYTKLLQGEGYEVFSAFNGKDLLSLFERLQYDFDLIISDVRIPGLENFDIGDYVALQSGDFIPIIGIAVYPRSEEHTSNSSHITISYAVFCLKKKKKTKYKKTKKNTTQLY